MDILSEIQTEISNFRTLQKASDHVNVLQYDLDKLRAELFALEKQLDKEYRDYEKLEGKSMKGFFYNILGSKEDQLEKERQEYLQLSLKYDELKASIQLKEFELDVLHKKVTQFEASRTKLDALKKRREQFLLSTSSQEGLKLRKIIAQMDETTRLLTDIDEALDVGQVLMQHLNKMVELLRSARNWGRWDMHGGKGRMYKYQKLTNIDRAKQVAYQIQNVITSFEREVHDVYPDFRGIQMTFDLDRFNGFADVFFDNLISDWIVQQKIVNSLNNVKTIHDRVTRLMNSLKVDREKTVEVNTQLFVDKDKVILGET
jgi:hypothetical protein